LGIVNAGTINGITINGSDFFAENSYNSVNLSGAGLTLVDKTTNSRTMLTDGFIALTNAVNTQTRIGSTFINTPQINSDEVQTNDILVDRLMDFQYNGIVIVNNLLRFGAGPSIDTTGGSARWKQSDLNYIRQNPGGDIQFYKDGNITSALDTVDFDNNTFLTGGGVGIKFLSSGSQLQVRNNADTAYTQVTASDFVTASKREYKTNINPYEKTALSQIKAMQVYTYIRKETQYGDIEGRYHIGHLQEDMPLLVRRDDGIDLYALCAFQTKSIQELLARIEKLEGVI